MLRAATLLPVFPFSVRGLSFAVAAASMFAFCRERERLTKCRNKLALSLVLFCSFGADRRRLKVAEAAFTSACLLPKLTDCWAFRASSANGLTHAAAAVVFIERTGAVNRVPENGNLKDAHRKYEFEGL